MTSDVCRNIAEGKAQMLSWPLNESKPLLTAGERDGLTLALALLTNMIEI